MQQSDFIERIQEILDSKGYRCVMGRIDTLKGKEGICVYEINRRLISSDYGGENTYSLIYQVVVRSRDPDTAESECWNIAELLQTADIRSSDNSFSFNFQEVYTSPQELELRDTLYYTWQVRFNAEIRQK